MEDWKADARALRALDFGAAAKVASRHEGIRSGVHQIWLTESPASSSFSAAVQQPLVLVGNIDARKELLRYVDMLRQCLLLVENDETDDDEGKVHRTLPAELMEISYLLYEADGAAYARHVDSFASSSKQQRRRQQRCVSFLIYLGDGADDGEDSTSGFGEERAGDDVKRCPGTVPATVGAFAYMTNPTPVRRENRSITLIIRVTSSSSSSGRQQQQQPQVWSDIAPQAGTVVLFDSATVPHEVLATKNRNRVCVVGWFGTYCCQ